LVSTLVYPERSRRALPDKTQNTDIQINKHFRLIELRLKRFFPYGIGGTNFNIALLNISIELMASSIITNTLLFFYIDLIVLFLLRFKPIKENL